MYFIPGSSFLNLILFCFFLFFLQCNNDYTPVCGSNNQNYQNECFLRRDACKQQSEVLILSEGAC
uniref:Kazal-like domain-containing protein n=1 Tax=Cynoglossus semilaevis TaxID=244447 RepID=A0A3P8VJ36_CYNSE